MYEFRPVPPCEITYFQYIEIPQQELTFMLLSKNDNRVCLSQAAFLTEKNMSPHLDLLSHDFWILIKTLLSIKKSLNEKIFHKSYSICFQVFCMLSKSYLVGIRAKKKRLAYPRDGQNLEERNRKLLSNRQIVLNDHGTLIDLFQASKGIICFYFVYYP